MIDHLIDFKVGYWDPEIRDLTSKVCVDKSTAFNFLVDVWFLFIYLINFWSISVFCKLLN